VTHRVPVPRCHGYSRVYYNSVSLVFPVLNLAFPNFLFYFCILSRCDTTEYGCASHAHTLLTFTSYPYRRTHTNRRTSGHKRGSAHVHTAAAAATAAATATHQSGASNSTSNDGSGRCSTTTNWAGTREREGGRAHENEGEGGRTIGKVGIREGGRAHERAGGRTRGRAGARGGWVHAQRQQQR
jgi:hypothetical protein